VRLFSEASVVIAPHGAGLTNIVFCQPGAIIIELLAPGYLVPYYWILASEAQLNYFYLIGEGMHGSHLRKIIYPNLLEEDLFININLLMQLLNIANAI